MSKVHWLGVALWVSLACCAVRAESPLHFEQPVQTLEHMPASLYSPHFPEGDDSWESWFYTFMFPNGTVLTSQFWISNVGPKDGTGLAVGLILNPGQAPVAMDNSRKRGEWTYSASDDGMKLEIARHTLEIHPPAHRIHMLHGRGEFTIEALSPGPALRPGKILFPDDQLYDLTLMAPRLTARAKARVEGQPEVDLGEGAGVGFYAYSNFGEHDQVLSWLHFDTFDRDVQVSLFEFTTPKDFDYQRVALLVLFDKGKVLATAYGYERKYQGFVEDEEKSKYRSPRQFQFSSQTGSVKVNGTVRLQPIYRLDVLEWVRSGIIRFLARRVSHPIDYKFRADYDLDLDRGDGKVETLHGSGFASFGLTNPPPRQF